MNVQLSTGRIKISTSCLEAVDFYPGGFPALVCPSLSRLVQDENLCSLVAGKQMLSYEHRESASVYSSDS